MRSRSFVVVSALVVALPAAAQQNPQHQQHPMRAQAPAMHQCMDMMGGPPAAMLLMHREQLELTADQVTRLEGIRDRTHASAHEHMQPVKEAHTRAAELLRADAPDLDEYEDALEDAAEHMVEAHVALVSGNLEARQVLTAEQRSKLATLGPMQAMAHGDTTAMPRMQQMHPPGDTAGRPAMGAMRQGGQMGDMQQMHQMMMMHCMMMGMDAHDGEQDGSHHD